MEMILSPSRLAPGLAVLMALAGTAVAQTPDTSTTSKTSSMSSSSNEEHDSTVHQRFWVGAYGSGTPFRVNSVHTYTDTNGDFYSSTKSGGIVGGGLNFNLRVTTNFWLNFGGVYRFGGYNTTSELNTSNLLVYTQRTRSGLIDFPLLVRYAGPKWRWSKYSFYELGGALRYSTSPQNSYTATSSTGGFCCAPASTDSFKRLIPGVAVGTGLVAKDDFGIKVAPEVRYIYWTSDTFHSSTVGTFRNQLEIGISFGF